MEVGEAVAPGGIDSDQTECPFDHAETKPPSVENNLIGDGGTLARRMKAGTSTLLYKPYVAKVAVVLDPRNREGHPFKGKAKVVKIKIQVTNPKKGDSGTVEHLFPVTCAAHHCIPAQESLKHSKLLAYMVKKGDSEDLKEGKRTITFSDGVVWADVGYDVNGAENGVFLPGNYAVGGGRGGMKVWEGATDNEDEDEEEPEVDVTAEDMMSDEPIKGGDPTSNLLTGALYDVHGKNRKWRYVIQAMKKAPGQFHDRHEDYSSFVLQVLEKLFANYQRLEKTKVTEEKCPECKKKASKIKELGVPTPFGLARRLNGVSERMRLLLSGGKWAPNVYTSKWASSYMTVLTKPSKSSLGKRKLED